MHVVADMAANYYAGNQDKLSLVYPENSPAELKEIIPFELGSSGTGIDSLLNYIKLYLENSVRTNHPQFYNQLWAGFGLPGFLGDVFAALSRTSMYTFEMAPVATLMELEVLRKMRSYLNWDRGEGTFTTGGSMSNLVALLCARNRIFPQSKLQGILPLSKQLVFFVSNQAHYSFEKAANVLGLGMQSCVAVATDDLGRMIPEKLEEAIIQAKRLNQLPFFVAATSGTTVLGAYDPIDAVIPIARKHGLWVHVDGSWGGSALLTKSHKHLMQGAEFADSMAWNPHKTLSVSLPCCVLLVRENGTLEHTAGTNNAEYLFREHEYDELDLGKLSLQTGRIVDSLKLWLSWKYYGDQGYEARCEQLFSLAKYAEASIQNHPDMQVIVPRSGLNLCFRWNNVKGNSNDQTRLNEFNRTLRQKILHDGHTMINVATLKSGDFAIRWVFANPEISEADIDDTIRIIENTASGLLHNN